MEIPSTNCNKRNNILFYICLLRFESHCYTQSKEKKRLIIFPTPGHIGDFTGIDSHKIKV